MTGVIEVEAITDADALARLAPDWWDLWERTPSATPFQSPAWLLAWWSAFAPGRLMTVAVRDGDRLAALAPLYIEAGPSGRRLLPIGIALSDYLDILADPDTAAADGITGHLSRCREWDAWEMCSLPPGADALHLPCPAGCDDTVAEDKTCPVLDLPPAGFDAGTHPAIPARQRRKLRMARHRLARAGSAAIITTDEWPARTWSDALVALHTRRWNARGEAGVLADPRARAFHAEALHGLMRRGLARLFALTIGGEIAGLYYGFSNRGRACAYLGGFDPRFAWHSPGTLLLGHAIEDALREGVRAFHFLRGAEAYKYAWGAVDHPTLRRTLVRRGPHGSPHV